MKNENLILKMFGGEVTYDTKEEETAIANDLVEWLTEKKIQITEGDLTLLYREKTVDDTGDYDLEINGETYHNLTPEECLDLGDEYMAESIASAE